MSAWLRVRAAILHFLEELTWEFRRSELVDTVNVAAEGAESRAEGVHIRRHIWRWITYMMKNPVANKGGVVRTLSALAEGLEAESMVLTRKDQEQALEWILSFVTGNSSQVVEYYVRTGEIMDIAECFRGADGIFDFHEVSHDHTKRFHQLYRYDVERIKEVIDAGTEPAEHMNLPLEMRMSFAGCWEDMTDGELNLKIDHRKVLPESIFDREHVNDGNMMS